MEHLGTSYLGISLKNPLIVSSSSLTNSVEKIQKLENAGAAAVVIKSLFEEQILRESVNLQETGEYYPEAADYLRAYVSGHSVSEYLKLVSDAKKSVSIPVFASINCLSDKGWMDYASKIEDAGADAIEINVYLIPTNKTRSSSEHEKTYFEIAKALCNKLSIPVVFKLGHQFSNIPYMVDQLYFRGVKGVVLFNRFFEPDINLRELTIKPADAFSSPSDLRYSLRWVAMVSAMVEHIEIAASTGIHDAGGVAKMLLAGAQVTQICSTIFKRGPEVISEILNDLSVWMKGHRFEEIDDFRGLLNYKNIDNPQLYERSQFMKTFTDYI